MKFTAKQIATLLKGSIDGDPDITVNTLSKIEEAKTGSLSFLANPAYTHFIYSTEASIVIVNNDFVPETTLKCTLVRVENSYMAFASLLEMYNEIKLNKVGISKQAFISETASIGKDCYIGEFAFIGENVVLGDHVKIYPQCYVGDNVIIKNNTTVFAGVKIYSENVIGANCTIHAGAVIGADGFGFAPQQDANYKKVAQIGNVILEDNVEIGANTTIDRATLGSTVIRKGVKLDNLIQIAHNVEIGDNTVIAAQSGVAGSSKVGKNCMIGGQVGIIGHLTVADNVKIAAQSGIGANVAENEIMQGSPAFSVSEYRRVYVHFRNLAKLAKRIDELERALKNANQKS